MKNKFTSTLLCVILGLAVLVGVFAAYKRLIIEAENSSVEFVMDLQDVKKLSLREGIPINKLFQELKEAGINSIALTEDTLDSLEIDGKVTWLTGYEQNTLYKLSKLSKVYKGSRLSPSAKRFRSPLVKTAVRSEKPNPQLSYVISDNKLLLARLEGGLGNVLGKNQVRFVFSDTLEITDDEEDLITLGVGISPERFKRVINMGFFVVPRLKNNYHLNSDKILQKLLTLKSESPFTTIIFDGDEVLGNKNYIPEVAKMFRDLDINYGYIEMAEQKGDSALLKAVKTNITRVHSIAEDEMLKKVSKEEALERFERAVVERGVRMLYIRPFYIPDKGKNLIETNINYISRLKERLSKSSHKVGQADRIESFSLNQNSLVLLSLGVCVGVIFLFSAFWQIPLWFIYLLLICAAAAPFAFKVAGAMLLFKKLAALTSAIVFPIIAITSVFKVGEGQQLSFPSISKSTLMVMASFVLSLIGAILIVGALADTLFMLGSQQFIGIKVAFVLPVLLVAFYCAVIEKEEIKSLKDRLLEWLNSPITVLTVVVGVVLLLAAALYILRSGNFGIGILNFEKLARTFLENIMIVRPRTKEFLIGYPALVLGAMYFLTGQKKWLWVFLVIGIVGPISTVNTFCHVHSPLLISLLRAMYGVILGIAVGLLYFAGYFLGRRFFKA